MLSILLLLLPASCYGVLQQQQQQQQSVKEVLAGSSVLFPCPDVQPLRTVSDSGSKRPGRLLIQLIHGEGSGQQVLLTRWAAIGQSQSTTSADSTFERSRLAWLKGVGAEGGGVRLDNVRPDDQGIYECRLNVEEFKASGGQPEVVQKLSSVYYLFVFEPPKIQNPLPPSLSVKRLSRLLLTCRVTGRPSPDNMWLHNGRRVLNENGVSVSRSGTLSIAQVTEQQAGLYECLAKNKVGEARAHTALLIEGGTQPDPWDVPSNLTRRRLERAELPCRAVSVEAAAAPGAPQPRWLKNNRDIQLIPELLHRYMIENGSLILPTLLISDIGWYSCQAGDGQLPTRTASTYLDVVHEPQFPTGAAQRTQLLTAGRGGSIECPALSNPPPVEVHWTHNYTKAGVSQGRLFRLLPSVEPRHAGIWKCHARNLLGWSSWSPELRVVVHGRPKQHQSGTAQIQQMIGTDCVIFCHSADLPQEAVQQKPTPTETTIVHWYKDDKQINFSSADNGRIRHSDNSRLLSIERLVPTDSGRYQCTAARAGRAAGSEFSLTQLLVETAPRRPPYNLSLALRPGGSSALLTWNPGSDSQRRLNYVVWFRAIGALGDGWSTIRVPTPSFAKVHILGLRPHTSYEFYVSAVASNGHQLQSEHRFAATGGVSDDAIEEADEGSDDRIMPTPRPPAAPSSLTLELHSSADAEVWLSWKASGEISRTDGGNNSAGRVQYYTVQYASESSGPEKWRDLELATPTSSSTNRQRLLSLGSRRLSRLSAAGGGRIRLRLLACNWLACSTSSNFVVLDLARLPSAGGGSAASSFSADGVVVIWLSLAIAAAVAVVVGAVACAIFGAVAAWRRKRRRRRLGCSRDIVGGQHSCAVPDGDDDIDPNQDDAAVEDEKGNRYQQRLLKQQQQQCRQLQRLHRRLRGRLLLASGETADSGSAGTADEEQQVDGMAIRLADEASICLTSFDRPSAQLGNK